MFTRNKLDLSEINLNFRLIFWFSQAPKNTIPKFGFSISYVEGNI